MDCVAKGFHLLDEVGGGLCQPLYRSKNLSECYVSITIYRVSSGQKINLSCSNNECVNNGSIRKPPLGFIDVPFNSIMPFIDSENHMK